MRFVERCEGKKTAKNKAIFAKSETTTDVLKRTLLVQLAIFMESHGMKGAQRRFCHGSKRMNTDKAFLYENALCLIRSDPL